MPDISMCANSGCELKETCYRYKAIPNPYRQSYASFKPVDGKCEHHKEIWKTDKIKK